jgi:hypothetical protein
LIPLFFRCVHNFEGIISILLVGVLSFSCRVLALRFELET